MPKLWVIIKVVRPGQLVNILNCSYELKKRYVLDFTIEGGRWKMVDDIRWVIKAGELREIDGLK